MRELLAGTAGLRVAVILAAAAAGQGCSSPSGSPMMMMGGERQSCYPNGTCNAGLICLSDLCVRPADGGIGGAGAVGAGGTSGATGAAGTTGTTGTGGATGVGGTSGTGGATGVGGTSGSGGATGSGGTSGLAGNSGSGGSGGTSGMAGTTGSGGTSGAAGTAGTSGSGGTIGTGGAAGSTLTCLQGASSPPAAALITDFSDAAPDPINSGQFRYGQSGGVTGGTATYASGTPGTLTLSGGALTYTATVEAPHGTDVYPYNGFTVFIDGPACTDASAYIGVAFTMSVAGDCKNLFMFADSDHLTPTNDPVRGSCAADPSQCYASQFVVSSSTTSVGFYATPAVTGMPKSAVDAAKLTGIQWQFSTPDGLPTACTGSITVDNIHFY
jgi:hypothetical protein